MGGSLTARLGAFSLTNGRKCGRNSGVMFHSLRFPRILARTATVAVQMFSIEPYSGPIGSETRLSQFLIYNIGVFRVVLDELFEVEETFLLNVCKSNSHPVCVAPNDF